MKRLRHLLDALGHAAKSFAAIVMSVTLLVVVGHVIYGRQAAQTHDHSSHSHAQQPALSSAWDNPPAGFGTSTRSSSNPPIPAEFAETIVGCEGLEITFEGERNTLLNLDHELLTMYPDDESPVTVRYSDAACAEHSTVGPLITHVLDEAFEDIQEECETLMAAIAAGELPTRGDFVPDMADAEAHIERWC